MQIGLRSRGKHDDITDGIPDYFTIHYGNRHKCGYFAMRVLIEASICLSEYFVYNCPI